MRIAVEDHGPGTRRRRTPHVFEPFYRGRDAVANQIQGSGLGLSLVRRIVEAHGGRVELDERARPRQHVHDLPAGRAAGAGAAGADAVRRRRRRTRRGLFACSIVAAGRLLLVEDEPGLQLTLSDRLIAEGYAVETAGDGDVGAGARHRRARST